MKLYRNIMEDIVEESLEDMLHFENCCNCPQCHADMMAYALNLLPPKYVVTNAGASISKAAQLRNQQTADIQAALTRAIDLVKKSPRHTVPIENDQ